MLLLFFIFNSLEYEIVFSLIKYKVNTYINIFNYNFNLITLLSICLFIAAVGKSAQFTLHSWLPDAMEGESRLIC